MHSSRMRTARLLAVFPSMHCAGGGCLLPGGVSTPRGGCLPRGCLFDGVSAQEGVSQHALRQTPPL